MKNILITGGLGFIGSHLAIRLAKMGHKITIIDNKSVGSNDTNPEVFTLKNIEVIRADFATYYPIFAEDVDIDVVFHLAASINVDESIENPVDYFHNNALGTLYFIKNLKAHKPDVKFIYACSAEVYGCARTEKISEDHSLDPLSPYAVSKLAAEQMLKNYAQLYGMDITIIRNFNTFGEYQRGDFYGGVISKFAHLAKEGKPLTVYGSGEQMRDYMHIQQAIDGYVLAMESKLPLIVNFGSGTPIKIIDIANYIAKEFGVEVVHTNARPNEIMRLEADISRASQYGYKISTDFWQNLKSYLDFIKNNK